MKKKIYINLIVAFATVYTLQSYAQPVSTYLFSQSNSTFTTIVGTTGYTQPANSPSDDTNYPGTPIGFTFIYDGTAYTTCSPEDDGNVTFGASTFYYSSPLSMAETIALIGRDLIGSSGYSPASHEGYVTTGVAPNRIFIYEWTNMYMYNGGQDAASHVSMQLMLYESTNCVQFVYGNCTVGANSYTCQVGLSGAFPTTDYNNRTSVTNWLSTTSGGYLSTCPYSTGATPSSGLTLTWCPSPICNFSLSIIATPESCHLSSDGSASASVSSGTPPFSYLWNTGATTSSITNLTEGYYFVSVTDSTGCWSFTGTRLNDIAQFCNYNIVKGICFIDQNNNGLRDTGELTYPNLSLTSTGNLNTYTSITDAQGAFYNFVDSGSVVTAPQNVLPYYTYSPAQHISNFSSYYNTDSVNFAFVPIPGYQDLRISLITMHGARPGFWVRYNLVYSNVGNTVSNGNIYLIKDSRLIVGTATPNYASVSGDTIMWTYTNLVPNETRTISITLPVPNIPIVNLGDIITSQAVIDPIASDSFPADNYSTVNHITVNSSDPNNKAMQLGETINSAQVANGEYLPYLINFQNTGTDTAYRVIIRDTLDNNLDGTTFEMISSSHVCSVNIMNNKDITFTFNNILLPDSFVNEPGSHGYVCYRVKPKNTVAGGDVIKNTANIFFDYNSPVLTNTAVTTVELITNYSINNQPSSRISLFPNPTNGSVILSYSLIKVSEVKIKLFNSLGQIIKEMINETEISGKHEVLFDTKNLPWGIYFVKITVDGNTGVMKMVKM